MTARQALAFVRRHGVVLESARGPVPSLAEAVAGGPVRGSWWGHPRSHAIFAATRAVRASEDVLVCRLVAGKVTFVHRDLWPALVRCEGRFPRKALAQVIERHTRSGQHVSFTVPFPRWVPVEIRNAARELTGAEALRQLGDWARPI